jgi:hypothetical protein
VSKSGGVRLPQSITLLHACRNPHLAEAESITGGDTRLTFYMYFIISKGKGCKSDSLLIQTPSKADYESPTDLISLSAFYNLIETLICSVVSAQAEK